MTDLEQLLLDRLGCNLDQAKHTTFSWWEIRLAAATAVEAERQACAAIAFEYEDDTIGEAIQARGDV